MRSTFRRNVSMDRESTRWRFVVRALIAIVLGVGGIVFATLPLAIFVAAAVYFVAGAISFWQLAQRQSVPVSSLFGSMDLLLRREIIWIYLVIAVGYESIFPEGVLLRLSLAVTTGIFIYFGGVCTQAIRRAEGRPISYRQYATRHTADRE
jgi:hypothetical protein